MGSSADFRPAKIGEELPDDVFNNLYKEVEHTIVEAIKASISKFFDINDIPTEVMDIVGTACIIVGMKHYVMAQMSAEDVQKRINQCARIALSDYAELKRQGKLEGTGWTEDAPKDPSKVN